jgi:hypothetical protein
MSRRRPETRCGVAVRLTGCRAVDRTTTKPLLDPAGGRFLVSLSNGTGVRPAPHSSSANCVRGMFSFKEYVKIIASD